MRTLILVHRKPLPAHSMRSAAAPHPSEHSYPHTARTCDGEPFPGTKSVLHPFLTPVDSLCTFASCAPKTLGAGVNAPR